MKLPEQEKEDIFTSVGQNVEEVEGRTEAGEQRVVQEIESLCMQCKENGMTRLLLTYIPHFREVVLMSFECPHCGFRNSEVQSAGIIQERGCMYTLVCRSQDDLNRQVVKSEHCVIKFSGLDLEIPAGRGSLTTVEGLLSQVMEDIGAEQSIRKEMDPENFEKIEVFLDKGRRILSGTDLPVTVLIDDISGNSWIEPSLDRAEDWTRQEYTRSHEQDAQLHIAQEQPQPETQEDGDDLKADEIHTFPASCSSCRLSCDTRMRVVDIPHFKEVVIMSTVCDHCGYRSNEVKTGGEVPSKGRKITLLVEDAEDLARDILKSETCEMTCQELNLHLHPGTLGGRFTTIEGLLTQVKEELYDRIFSPQSDSMEPEKKGRWQAFFNGLNEAREGKRKFTLVLNDPMGASYLQNLYAPDPDPNMTTEEIERTDEQNEELGLNDLNVENYKV